MQQTFLCLTLGTNNLPRAARFYDAALASLGLLRRATKEVEVGYGHRGDIRCRIWITRPFDGRSATVGNGSMAALIAPDRASVDRFHAAACATGGTDEGAPALRPHGPGFYAAYVRDPDGNKLSAVCLDLGPG